MIKALVIEQKGIKSNIKIVKKYAEDAVIYAVLNGDAYGMGLKEMARLLRDEGIGRFAVSEPEAAATLRQEGFVDEEILMLRSTCDPKELEQLMDFNVVCTIGSPDSGIALNGIAERRSTVVEAHVQIDTGMGCSGFLPADLDKILAPYRYLPNVAVSGIYTQIQGSGRRRQQVQVQMKLFGEIVERIRSEGFETGLVHAGGSSALLWYRVADLDAVQVGTAFYGRSKGSVKGDGLSPIGRGEATLGEVRWFPKGHTVGQESRVKLRKPARLAVLPVGWYHGVGIQYKKKSGLAGLLSRWSAQSKLAVRIKNNRAKVLGRPGMFETVVDVTDISCSVGDIAAFDLNPLFAKGLKRVYQ